MDVEKQIQNLNGGLVKNLVKEIQNIDKNTQECQKVIEEIAIKMQVEKHDKNEEINFIDVQMLEYEASMEELEEKTKLEKSHLYKLFLLNLCKSLENTTPKIYHNVTDKRGWKEY